MTIWTYRGRNVDISQMADVPNALQPGSKYDHLVLRALQTIEPWEEGESPHLTVRTRPGLYQPIMLNDGRNPMWGKYIGHRFEHVGLSPFLVLRKSENAPITHTLTIEMHGTPANPVLYRAYPGPYQPPLPWEYRARWEPGGIAACTAFWRLCSYVYRAGLVKGKLSSKPPDWFTA